jgi:hypothetical protein
MIEFVVVYLLARRNGRLVEAKGHSGTSYRWGTVGLWFGFEIVGFIVGSALMRPARDEITGVYLLFGLGGAAIGAAISYLWANSAPMLGTPISYPTHMTPPAGMPAWAQPDPSAQPVTVLPPQMPVILVTRQGDWALVRIANGWQGWVDARILVPGPGASPWQPPQ